MKGSGSSAGAVRPVAIQGIFLLGAALVGALLTVTVGRMLSRGGTRPETPLADVPSQLPKDDDRKSGLEFQRARDEKYRARFRDEVRDLSWANGAEAKIREIVSAAVANQHDSAIIEDISCRATICQVTMKWPSFGDATAQFRGLLGLNMPCSSEMFVPQPNNQSAPYEATLMLGCGSWRQSPPP